jgi:hypothetical protein
MSAHYEQLEWRRLYPPEILVRPRSPSRKEMLRDSGRDLGAGVSAI